MNEKEWRIIIINNKQAEIIRNKQKKKNITKCKAFYSIIQQILVSKRRFYSFINKLIINQIKFYFIKHCSFIIIEF